MPKIGADGWTVELTEAKRAKADAAVKAWADKIVADIPPGGRLFIEASNETGHFDLETGEYIMDNYTENFEEIFPKGYSG